MKATLETQRYFLKRAPIRASAKFFSVHPNTISARLREMGVEIRKL